MSHDSGGSPSGKPTLGLRVIGIEKISIPIIKEEHLLGYLRFTVHMQAKDDLTFARLDKIKPLLEDAIYRDMYSVMSDLWISDKDPRLESVQRRTQKVADTFFSHPGDVTTHIRELFLQRLPASLKK